MRISDWSSDVCSSDLSKRMPSLGSGPLTAVPCVAGIGVSRYSYSVDRYRLSSYMPPMADRLADTGAWPCERKSVVEGKSVSGRVDTGGPRILIKKKNNMIQSIYIDNIV